jgi:hypothetical protein
MHKHNFLRNTENISIMSYSITHVIYLRRFCFNFSRSEHNWPNSHNGHFEFPNETIIIFNDVDNLSTISSKIEMEKAN